MGQQLEQYCWVHKAILQRGPYEQSLRWYAKFSSQQLQHLKSIYCVVFAATDNCSAVLDLVSLLPAQKIFSPCINMSSTNSHHQVTLLSDYTHIRRHGGPNSSYALLADIEMLRRGQHFFGLFDSNLVRMIHRLRYPLLNNSHALAVETYKDSKVGLNLNMEDIGPQLDN